MKNCSRRPRTRNESPGGWERLEAAEALERLGRTEEALQIYRSLARDGGLEIQARREIAWALERLGYADEAAMIHQSIARDEHVARIWERLAAARSLERLGYAEEAARTYQALARNRGLKAREQLKAAEALERLGRTEETVEVLLALLDPERPEWAVRKAIQALVRLGGIPAGRAIRAAVEHHSEEMASQIASALRETPKGLQDVPSEDILKLVTSFPAAGKRVVEAASRLDPPPDWLAAAAIAIPGEKPDIRFSLLFPGQR